MQNTENDTDVPGDKAGQHSDPRANDADVADNKAAQSSAPVGDSSHESGRGPNLQRMSDDDHDGEIAASREESMIDETLHHALSDLEQILEQRQGATAPYDTGQPTGEALVDEDSNQYTIPLLDDVVRPGSEPQVPPTQVSATKPQQIQDPESRSEFQDDSEPALRRRLAERLASEIEIITQDRIEAALEKAHAEIRVQVRNHLDIILPEVVEELSQARRRRDSDADH